MKSLRDTPAHLLLIRFSALGDILMTVPVVDALARQYPEVSITVVSRPWVGSVFGLLPENVSFVGINPRDYPGISGLWKMFCQLRALKPSCVCDLHDVLRTKVLRLFFRGAGVPVFHINKERKARRAFLHQERKEQQITSFDKYARVLREAGYEVNLAEEQRRTLVKGQKQAAVGIAPFAAHQGKIYPMEKMEEVIRLLSASYQIFLFGAGSKERQLTEAWEKKFPNVVSMVGKLPDMRHELECMASLKAMLTMDSGNMHLAALTDTPVVSLWGATHPLGGFLGWNQAMEHCVQRDLPCRPCSIYGQKPCRYGDYRCMNQIAPEEVAEKVRSVCK